MPSRKINYSLRLRKSFFHMLLVVIGVVLIWRGIWNLIDAYLLPGHPFISNVLSIVVGLFILYLPDRDLKELV